MPPSGFLGLPTILKQKYNRDKVETNMLNSYRKKGGGEANGGPYNSIALGGSTSQTIENNLKEIFVQYLFLKNVDKSFN